MTIDPTPKETRKTIVVIGNGMVGHRFCTRLTDLDADARFRIVTFYEEPRPAYDRVNLTKYLSEGSADALRLADPDWYREKGIDLHIGERATSIDRDRQIVRSDKETQIPYDYVVLATGSHPFVPPIKGIEKRGVFVYRTIEDLESIRKYSANARSAAVLGGGLLGLEAAKAVFDLGLETHVIEFAPRLMPRQLDADGAELLKNEIADLGVSIHLGMKTDSILGNGSVQGLRFGDGETLEVDMLIVSTGIRPRDDLARESGLEVSDRGGVVVDDRLATSDPKIFAIGEVALHRGMIYGLVAPGYEMAEVVAGNFAGVGDRFEGADLSTRLKLLGVEVATFGDLSGESGSTKQISFKDAHKGIYKRIDVCRESGKLLGGMLVGDASDYARLLSKVRSGESVGENPDSLILGDRNGSDSCGSDLDDDAQVCQCNNISKAQIKASIGEYDLTTVEQVRARTTAGGGCGGCLPLVGSILNSELQRAGKSVKRDLCEHFAYSRQELFDLVRVRKITTFAELLEQHGRGSGCEICKPAAASILASLWNDHIFEHATIQDTNDRFLANIQRGGSYSVIPRVPGGEITPEKLIALGTVAKKYDLYCKITGGQRIDLLGARVEQLPDIWEELIDAGFESGHAYGKALRTVKSCVGWTWCRYGIQDSTSMAIRVEERYRGIRAPHKIKGAVSGCARECAEAQSKDFGLIASEKGWNLYVCGNGGMRPRHADLLASDLDDDTVIRYIDRFIMYYIHTADRLTRTSVWLEGLEGGIDHLREVIVDDKLGLCDELEADIERLIRSYRCEWKEVVADPAKRAEFKHFADSDRPDPSVRFVRERNQIRPTHWTDIEPKAAPPDNFLESDRDGFEHLKDAEWFKAAPASRIPREGGRAIDYEGQQIAIFHFASRGEWFACQNMCPHRRDMILARGLLGDRNGVPKVSCPLHKKQFSLDGGECLSGEDLSILTFPVKIEDGFVHVKLPRAEVLDRLISGQECAREATAAF